MTLMAGFKTDYKYKYKIHSKLYHFINKDIYISLVDNKSCIKGFVGKGVT